MFPTRIDGDLDSYADPDMDTIPDPLPTLEIAEFIAWLTKRGYIRNKIQCVAKCRQIGIDLEKDIISIYCPDKILVGRTPGGEILVKIIDKSWAQQVSDFYDRTLPHHSFPTALP